MIKRFARWFAKNGLVASIVSLVVISVVVLTLYSESVPFQVRIGYHILQHYKALGRAYD